MGLITKEVEIGLSNNIKYYESLTYTIPKYIDAQDRLKVKQGTKIKVKIEDLPDGSGAKVDVQCDSCKDIKNIKIDNYKTYVKEDGKYYCRKCATKLFREKKTRKTKLENGKSFEQWCIENNRQDVLDRWDYELNNCDPSGICCGTNKKYYFKCPRQVHKSELKQICSLTSFSQKNIDCHRCNSFVQWGIDNLGEDFLEKYWDYQKNININPWEITKNSHKKVWIKCQEKNYHGSYDVNCYNFINVNNRCSFCSNHKIHLKDSLATLFPQAIEIWSDKNKKSPYEYSPKSNQEVYWKCQKEKHNDYKRNINNSNRSDFYCPECVKERDESFLQEKVRLYLNKLNYSLFHEYNCILKCINPKTNYQLPYDNEIIINDEHLIIEVHGQQHYHEVSGKWFNRNFDLHYQKIKDRYKRMYAKSQGYNYLEIPYWTDDKNKTWKMMIDEKIRKVIYGV